MIIIDYSKGWEPGGAREMGREGYGEGKGEEGEGGKKWDGRGGTREKCEA